MKKAHVILVMTIVAHCSMSAMFKVSAAKYVVASVAAAGTAVGVNKWPNMQQHVAHWQAKKQWKKEVAEQNKVKESHR